MRQINYETQLEEKQKVEQKYMVQEAIDKMKFLKRNYKQLKSMERQLFEAAGSAVPQRLDPTEVPSGFHGSSAVSNLMNSLEYGYGGIGSVDQGESIEESEEYDAMVPMKEFQTHTDDTNSFAKDIMPPLG